MARERGLALRGARAASWSNFFGKTEND